MLLVEDDETVRRVLTRQLQGNGTDVVAAEDSRAAEAAFAGQGPFDVVISDVVMPGELQGPALVRRLRETEPDLPAIFLSGYPLEATDHKGDIRAGDTLLLKPISREDLGAAIDVAVQRPEQP